MSIMGVYEIYCMKSEKRYIGSSKDVEKRWEAHLNGLRNGKHHNYYLQKAYYRYGEENFVFSILEETNDIDLLYEIELIYINKFKFNRLFNVMRKPGEVPKRESRWMQHNSNKKKKEEKKEEWAFGGKE